MSTDHIVLLLSTFPRPPQRFEHLEDRDYEDRSYLFLCPQCPVYDMTERRDIYWAHYPVARMESERVIISQDLCHL